MFELTPDERMKALIRRNGKVVKKGELSPEMIRRYTTSVTFQSTLMKEFTNVLDYGKDVYCPQCAVTTDHGAVTAWPLAPLLGKNPMADTGDMVSFTCLHCGFVEHHKAPKMPRDEDAMTAIETQHRYKQAQLGAMYGGPFPRGLQQTATEMQIMQREMERLSGMTNSLPVKSSLADEMTKSDSFREYVKKHLGMG